MRSMVMPKRFLMVITSRYCLSLTHHESTCDDKHLLENPQKAKAYLNAQKSNSDLQVDLAVEGLSIKI